MKRFLAAATVALMLVAWAGSASAHGRDGRSSRSRRAASRRRHVRSERSRRLRTQRSRDAHRRHRTRVYYFPSDYNGARKRAYNDEDECD